MDEKEKQVDVVDTIEETGDVEQKVVVEKSNENQMPTMAEDEEELAPLFENNEADRFRSHWLEIQSRFVDDPRASVAEANKLVDEVINNITETFARKRTFLENHWNRGGDVSTEDLRIAIKHYRSFFDRLLSLES